MKKTILLFCAVTFLPALALAQDDGGMSGGVGSAYDLSPNHSGGVAPAVPSVNPAEPVLNNPPLPVDGNAVETAPLSQPSSITPAPSSINDGPMADAPTAIPYGGSIGAAPPEKNSLEGAKFCTFKISFTSICCGTQGAVETRMVEYLKSQSDKLSFTEEKWGDEGESDYCVDVKKHSDRAAVYTALKKLMPLKKDKDPNQTGDVILSGSGFTTITTKD